MVQHARRSAAMLLLMGSGMAGLTVAGPGWAQADPLRTEVSASSWYWAEQSPAAGGNDLPVSAPTQASDVPAGDRGVAFTNQTDKVTAVAFNTRTVPTGAVFSTFTLTMGLDPAAHQLANGTPSLVACEATGPVPANLDPGALSAAPGSNLLACANGVLDVATSSYTFELKTIATRWAAGGAAYGVVVQPKPGDNTPFTYALRPDSTYAVAAAFTAPVPTAAPTSTHRATPAAVPVAPTTPTQGELPAPLPDLVAPTVEVLPADPAPVVAPMAVLAAVAAPAPAPVTVRRSRSVVEQLRPTAVFWVAAGALVALLAGVSLVLGDPLAPEAPDARRRRFAQVVRARTTARGTHAPAPLVDAPGARPAGQVRPA